MSFVLDASVAVEYLLRTRLGEQVAPMIEATELYAPELLDAEVLAVLRREVVRARLDEARAVEAIDDLGSWQLERISHRLLLERAWSLRHNVSAYDALYVAAALECGATVLTADGPLSRAPAFGAPIQNVRV